MVYFLEWVGVELDLIGLVNVIFNGIYVLNGFIKMFEEKIGKLVLVEEVMDDVDDFLFGIEKIYYLDNMKVIEVGFVFNDLKVWLLVLVIVILKEN